MTLPSARSTLNRRTMLRAAALAALTIPAASGLTACTSGYSDEPDPLRPVWLRASADAKAAEALAASSAEEAELARLVATVRSIQADALRREVERLNRPIPEEGTDSPEPTVQGLEQLGARLDEARQEATGLVAGLPRHRAALVGAVTAGCAAAQQLSPAFGDDGAVPAEQLTSQAAAALGEDGAAAMQKALRAEHAAIWVYTLVQAFLSADFGKGVTEGARVHRERRDAAEQALSGTGHTPRPAEPAYTLPRPVTDEESATSAVVTAEADAATAWYEVLEQTDDKAVRALAVQCLTGAATRGVHWRLEAGVEPAAPPLPGRHATAS